MLVMLLGQTRVLYSMAKGWTASQKLPTSIPSSEPLKNTILVGLLAAIMGGTTLIDDIGKMVNLEHCWPLSSFDRGVRAAAHEPGAAASVPDTLVPLVPILGVISNGCMMYELGWVDWARLFIWLGIGLVVYFSYGSFHSRVQADLAAAKAAANMAD